MSQLIAIGIFALIITGGFALVYKYAKHIEPKKQPLVVIIGWVVFMALCVWNPLLSFLPFIFYLLFCLFYYRKKNNKALQQFFTDFGIYKTPVPPASVATVLGNCNWSCAEGKVYTKSNKNMDFNWWQGYTISTSYSNGRSSSSITNYLSISLPPGQATAAFREKVKAIVDASKASFGQRFKRFFVRSTYIPYLVQETPDGYFVIAWYMNPTVKNYSEKIKWLMENG